MVGGKSLGRSEKKLLCSEGSVQGTEEFQLCLRDSSIKYFFSEPVRLSSLDDVVLVKNLMQDCTDPCLGVPLSINWMTRCRVGGVFGLLGAFHSPDHKSCVKINFVAKYRLAMKKKYLTVFPSPYPTQTCYLYQYEGAGNDGGLGWT